MNKIIPVLLTLLLQIPAVAATVRGRQHPLTDNWTLIGPDTRGLDGAAVSRPGDFPGVTASVPSTVMGALTAQGSYPDLLEGMHYREADRSPFDHPWWYRKAFSLPAPRPGEHILLELDGISYTGDIWLNGHYIDRTEGPFRQFCYDVTEYIQEENILAVRLERARPGQPGIGFVDWNPRPLDESMGLFREVRLVTTGPVALQHGAVRSHLDCPGYAWADLTVDVRAVNLSDQPVQGRIAGRFDGRVFSAPVTLAPGEERQVLLTPDNCPALHLEKPRVWWCNGMGSPELYDMELQFLTREGCSDSQTFTFGIRKVEQRLDAAGHVAFRLNGRDVLLRGAGWTDDIFLRDDERSNALQLGYVRDMNLNMVRLEEFWGTSENLYDLCDRYGLMVLAGWSCFWEWEIYLGKPHDPLYGGILTPAEIDLTAESFADQVLWLRSHPSIIAWFTGSDRIPHPDLEPKYRDFLAANDDRGYLISASGLTSPVSGPSGTKMRGPYEYVGPVYWYSPQAPGSAVGFNTETGIGAQLPVRESLEKMGLPMTWPTGEEWDFHCTSAAEDMHALKALKQAVEGKYGTPEGLDDFLRKASHLNYDGTRAMFEAFRVNVPQATGIVQWMLNSAWPSLYWQLYDWYGQPTAAYYATRHANEPVQLIYHYADRCLYAVNETCETMEAEAVIDIWKADGSPAFKARRKVRAEPFHPVKVASLPAPANGCHFLLTRLEGARGAVIARNEYVLSCAEDQHDWNASNWYQTPISRYADLRPLGRLHTPAPQIQARLDESLEVVVTLSNPGRGIAFFNRLWIKDAAGELLCPAQWEDNYLTLAPGETRTVRCRLRAEDALRAETVGVKGWDLSERSVSLR